jgi:hypothetical protein
MVGLKMSLKKSLSAVDGGALANSFGQRSMKIYSDGKQLQQEMTM